MRRICCSCLQYLGDKPPLDDESETHTYCDPCHAVELAKIAAQVAEMDRELDEKRC